MIRFDLFAQDINNTFRSLPKPEATPGRVETVIDEVLITVGALCVLMIAIGGIRYIASRGEADQIAQAKNTIIYAIVGIVICIFAYAIVRFVVGNLT